MSVVSCTFKHSRSRTGLARSQYIKGRYQHTNWEIQPLVIDSWLTLRNIWFKFKDFKQIVDNFRRIGRRYLELKLKTKKYQHVINWTWKHLDVNRFCPKSPWTLVFTLNNDLNSLEASLSLSPSNQWKLSLVLKKYGHFHTPV